MAKDENREKHEKKLGFRLFSLAKLLLASLSAQPLKRGLSRRNAIS